MFFAFKRARHRSLRKSFRQIRRARAGANAYGWTGLRRVRAIITVKRKRVTDTAVQPQWPDGYPVYAAVTRRAPGRFGPGARRSTLNDFGGGGGAHPHNDERIIIIIIRKKTQNIHTAGDGAAAGDRAHGIRYNCCQTATPEINQREVAGRSFAYTIEYMFVMRARVPSAGGFLAWVRPGLNDERPRRFIWRRSSVPWREK